MNAAFNEPPDPPTAASLAARQLEFEIEFFGSVLKRAPDYIDVLRIQGELLSRKGDHEKALLVDRRLCELLPEQPIGWYNLACSLAVTGAHAEALDALERAFETGYDDLEHIQEDSDLDGLRENPRFRDLLDRYQPASS